MSTSVHRSAPCDDVMLLAGAGASAYLGLPALADLLQQAHVGPDSDVADRIRRTRNAVEANSARFAPAVFEEVIAQLKYYVETAVLLRTDSTFACELGSMPADVVTGVVEHKWNEALTECYRVLVREYGPQSIDPRSVELKTVVRLLEELCGINDGHLDIYTTNYDCSYQVLASNCRTIQFFTHINNTTGHFSEQWHPASPGLADSRLPSVYVHRLHGCVGWFTDEGTPFSTEEVYGSGEHLDVADDEYLNRMCIKLVSSENVGAKPAFASAFEEFSAHLATARVLLVWGYGFRDLEVLRVINHAFSVRATPLPIYYVDPFLTEPSAIHRIRRTLREAPVQVAPQLRPKQVDWRPGDGHDRLVQAIVEALTQGG